MNTVGVNSNGCLPDLEVPCEIWMKTRDPKYSDEEFAENVRTRIAALKEM